MIKAPFNFVPLSQKVYFPDWADQVSQDMPFEDGEDGIIELELTNVTALFTRNGCRRNEKEDLSAHVIEVNGRRNYYLPGTSLKGCFRSIMEIMTFAKMGPYNDDSFAMPRAFDTKDSTNAPYINATKHVKCGWLQPKGEEYEIIPCQKGIQEISHKKVVEYYPTFNKGQDHQTAQIKQESLTNGVELYPKLYVKEGTIQYKVNNQVRIVPEGEYRVVCTGYMNGKNHEYLFSTEEGSALPVSEKLFKTFESVHSRTVYYNGHGDDKGFLRTRLQTGQRIPVFYTTDSNGVVAIGITKKLRIPYAYGVSNGIANCRGSKVDQNKPDMPETIFGYTRKDTSLKGRVSFTAAFCQNDVSDESLIHVQGVQGQPSASYYPLYLRHDGKKYSIYDDKGVQIAGRKRYRISEGNHVMELPKGNDNEKVLGSFRALPAGQTFKGKVILHNLRKAEIGALLASITMNNTPGTYLNLGLAKSFGYGKLTCKLQLKGLKYTEEEYMQAFEIELMQNGFDMGSEESLNQLVAIASEHEDAGMYMMNLEEYEESKKNNTFSTLKEASIHVKTHINKEQYLKHVEKKQQEMEEQQALIKMQNTLNGYIDQARKLMEVKQWSDAINQLNNAMAAAEKIKADTTNIQKLMEECIRNKEAVSHADLQTTLEGKASLGNIANTTKTWIKKGNTFGDNELQTLISVIDALPDKEKKGLKGKRKDFVKAIGEEWATKLFAHYGL